jgi:gamma-butyrobetaine dioxygenase
MLSTTRALRSTAKVLGRRPLSSATRPRSAAVVSPPSSLSPSPSPVSQQEAEQLAEQLKPQPFILRPLSRRLQLKQVSSPPSDPHSATLHFVSPLFPSSPKTLTIPNLFLRDSSIHPDHVHPSSRQKLFRTTDVPLDGKLVGYGVHDVPGHGECLVTEWSTALRDESIPVQTRKLSVIPVDFLAGILKGDAEHKEAEGTLPPTQPWDRAKLEAGLKRTPYEAFKTDDVALRETLDALTRDGIVLLMGVPTEEKEGHATELRRVVERIGTLKRTWYGDLWDVRAKEDSENIAYTNLDLGLHMDLVYVYSLFSLEV